MFDEYVCVSCGCTDDNACIDAETHQPCFWVHVDYRTGKGICSVCAAKMQEQLIQINQKVQITLAQISKKIRGLALLITISHKMKNGRAKRGKQYLKACQLIYKN